VEAQDPEILEITSFQWLSHCHGHADGQADDEPLRSAARAIKDDLEQIPGVDFGARAGFQDPELQVEFDPPALAARGLTAADLAEALRLWFRDVFAGKINTRSGEWLVRVSGTTTDPEAWPVSICNRQAQPTPHSVGRRCPSAAGSPGSVATGRHGRSTGGDAVDQQNQLYQHPGISGTEFAITSTARIRSGRSDLKLLLTDDQTIPTARRLASCKATPPVGLLLVLGTCWLFLALTHLYHQVALGVVFSLTGAFMPAGCGRINAERFRVLLASSVLVCWWTMRWSSSKPPTFAWSGALAALDAVLDALREVGLPVFAAVSTTDCCLSCRLMLCRGIVGKFMFVIPFCRYGG